MKGTRPLRVLIVEDQQSDADLVLFELRRHGYAPHMERVQTAGEMRASLTAGEWDVIISDFHLPHFSAMQALKVAREFEDRELPFIIVSGSVGEEAAVEALTSGAHDFVSKDNLARLIPSIERSLSNARVRRERRDLVSALQQAVRARDEFLSIAAHELRTPITTLKLQAQSLIRLQKESPVASKLNVILSQTRRLEELVDRLLDVSRVTSGPLQLEPEGEVDLTAMVRETAASFSGELLRCGSELEIDAPKPVAGRWDRFRLQIVVTNLLSNALKYGEGNPIKVTVGSDHDRATLQVTDRGIGIAPEAQARIFERFERAVPVVHYGGFGVGLWLVRRIVEAHGGTIRVRSAEGEGSEFTVELPIG